MIQQRVLFLYTQLAHHKARVSFSVWFFNELIASISKELLHDQVLLFVLQILQNGKKRKKAYNAMHTQDLSG
jgi:hypothetical protein